jgi:hypothetical protein
MKDRIEIKKRFMADEVPIRLGGIASNLARVSSFSENSKHHAAVMDLIDESKFFIEWTAAEAEANAQHDLVRIQVELARWHIRAGDKWDSDTRRALASAAREWSNTVLDISGLLNES